MEKPINGDAPPQSLNCSIREMPDGALRLHFGLVPTGQYAGMIEAHALTPDLLCAMAQTLQGVANSRRKTVQAVPAGALAVLGGRKNGG